MVRLLVVLLLASSTPGLTWAQMAAERAAQLSAPYGFNAAAGRTFEHGGISLYYETYGEGEPVLFVHGNGGNISSVASQIEDFRQRYFVIAMDSRGHGKSGDIDGPLRNEDIADDLAALIEHLGRGPVNVVGWSDGAVSALLLGLRHPRSVRKIVAMAASVSTGEDANFPEVIALAKTAIQNAEAMPDTPQNRRTRKFAHLLLYQPDISLQSLESLTVPTLVMAGDHDLVRDEHTVAIFHHIPNSELAILPGSTHEIPFDDPRLFDSTVERFLREPFVKKDRIQDVLKSLEQSKEMKAALAARADERN